MAFPIFYPYRPDPSSICQNGCSYYQFKSLKNNIRIPSFYTKPENPNTKRIMIVLDIPIAGNLIGFNYNNGTYQSLCQLSLEHKILQVILNTLIDEHTQLFITHAFKCDPHPHFLEYHRKYIFTSAKEIESKNAQKALYNNEHAHFQYCSNHLIQEIKAYKPEVIIACGHRVVSILSPENAKDIYNSRIFKELKFDDLDVCLISSIGLREIALSNHHASQLKVDIAKALWYGSSEYRPEFRNIPTNLQLHAITDLKVFQGYVDYLRESGIPFAWDTETANLKKIENLVYMLSFSYDGINGYTIPVKGGTVINIPDEAGWSKAIKELLSLPNEKICFNSKFDMEVIATIQEDPNWLPVNTLWDTWMLAYCFEENFGEKDWEDEKNKGLTNVAYKWGSLAGQVIDILGIWDPQWLKDKEDRSDMTGAIQRKGWMNEAQYAGKDAIYTYRLWIAYLDLMKRAQVKELKVVRDMLSKHIYTLTRIEQAGLPINKEMIEWMSNPTNIGSIAYEYDQAKKEFLKLSNVQKYCSLKAANQPIKAKPHKRVSLFANTPTITLAAPEPINLNSPKQLADFFFSFMGLEPLREQSTDKEFIAHYVDKVPEVKFLKIVKEREKVLGTYLPGFTNSASQYSDYRVRAQYFLTTITGRTSCSDPNLQNIPRAEETANEIKGLVKDIIVAREGYALVSMDYSTAEVRFLAIQAQDSKFAALFKKVDSYREKFIKNPSKDLYYLLSTEADAHKQNAAIVNNISIKEVTKELRNEAKKVVFKLIYDANPVFSLALDIGVSEERVKEIIDSLLGKYPRTKAWFVEVEAQAREEGCTRSIFGRRRATYGYYSRLKKQQSHAQNITRNAPIQGGASDWTLLAAYDIQKLFRSSDLDIRIVNVVHDAIIVECPIDALQEWVPKILRTMERPPSVAQLGIDLDLVPMAADAEIGKNYKDLAKWDDTSEMLICIKNWILDGASKDRIPQTIYK
jgi:DNA polymerase I-like protein with 3'-5' exonuclease and polymerase domains